MPSQPAAPSSSSDPVTAASASTVDTASQSTNMTKQASILAEFSHKFTEAAKDATFHSTSRCMSVMQRPRFGQLSLLYSRLAASADSAQNMLTQGPSLFHKIHDDIVYVNTIRTKLAKRPPVMHQGDAESGRDLQTRFQEAAFTAYLLSHCPDLDFNVEIRGTSIASDFWHEVSEVAFAEQTDDHIGRRADAFRLAMSEARDSKGIAITVLEPQHLGPVVTDG